MESNNQVWTEEIISGKSLFSVNLKEVWRYRDLLLMLVKRDFILFYKQTILGPIWFLYSTNFYYLNICCFIWSSSKIIYLMVYLKWCFICLGSPFGIIFQKY